MAKKIIYGVFILGIIGIGYMVYWSIQDAKVQREYREWVAGLEHSASEQVCILKDTILIDYLNEKRTLSVYLPMDYEQDTVDYPVIYFLDGQSLFDQKIQEGDEWRVDEVIDSLGILGQQQAIVVGVYSSEQRLTEYKPFLSPRIRNEKEVSGDKHAEWMATDLKEWVDSRYRTDKSVAATTVGGASLGGLMAYYMLMTYPEVYGNAIVFSPSFWVNDQVFDLHENVPNLADKKIYFDAGQLETPTVEDAQKMHDLLVRSGMPEDNIRFDVEEGDGHWHMTWQKGFSKAYPWIVER